MKKLFILLALVGCDPNPNVQSKTNVGLMENVEIVILEDGTRCATYKAGYAGGISCDWR